ncbi:MAG: FkbM family methyltransferase [Rhodobacteraceae bacterium]|nr:MAG: FkbM family methyltransferase [Paracoccaceae bacterium]
MPEWTQDLRRFVQSCLAMGLPGCLRFLRHRPGTRVRAQVHGCPLTLRRSGPDLRVAVANLGKEFHCLEAHIPEGFDGVIVDAGAFIGSASLALARRFPNARVIAVEPSSENYALLSANVAQEPRITPIRAALMPEGAGSATLHDRGTGGWGYTIVAAPGDAAATTLEKVPVVTLSEIADRVAPSPIGVVKLDIEGAELALLDPPDAVLAATPVILAELHDRIVPGTRKAFDRFAPRRPRIDSGGEKFLLLPEGAVPRH